MTCALTHNGCGPHSINWHRLARRSRVAYTALPLAKRILRRANGSENRSRYPDWNSARTVPEIIRQFWLAGSILPLHFCLALILILFPMVDASMARWA